MSAVPLESPRAASGPTPALFFETIHAFHRTGALTAGLALDLFTKIGERGLAGVDELAKSTGASPKGIRVLCDYLTLIGFLNKADGEYSLTQDSAVFLDRRSPACLASSLSFLRDPRVDDFAQEMLAAVRKGGTVQENEGHISPENPVWVEFARGMVPIVMGAAQEIPRLINAQRGDKWRVLDIAAGHGMFGIQVAKANPNAQIVAVDWQNVLAVATENARAAGVSDRHQTIAGSAFDADFGGPYHVVLLTNFLHHFDAETNEGLLRKIRKALKPKGRVVTLEFVPNEDRIAPPLPAMFAMIMLLKTPQGDAYTFSELERMFRNAGFERTEAYPLSASPEKVLISS